MKSLIGTTHCGFELVVQKPYSAEFGYGFLSVVGGVRVSNPPTQELAPGSIVTLMDGTWQAVTWVHNASADGFVQGDYSIPVATRAEALADMMTSFNDRGLGRGLREAHMVEAHKAGVAGEKRRRGELLARIDALLQGEDYIDTGDEVELLESLREHLR